MDINRENRCGGHVDKVFKEKDAVPAHKLKESFKKLLEEKKKVTLENTNLKQKICNLDEQICNLKIEAEKSDKVISTIILEKTVLEEKLKDNMKLIHSFAERTVEARKAPGLKSIAKLCKEFQKVDTNLNLWYSDVLTVSSLVQDIQASCNDCRARHKKDKETYEKTIKSLEDSKTNNEFLIQQLTHQVNEYSEEIHHLKRDLLLKKDKAKELKFSGSMPPTPESFTNSNDSEESMQTQLSTESKPESEPKPLSNNSNSNSKSLYIKAELSPQFCNDQYSHLETAKSDERISLTCQTHVGFSLTKLDHQKSPLNKSDDSAEVIPNNIHVLECKSDKPVFKSEEFTILNDFFGYISEDSEEDDNFEIKKASAVENAITREPHSVDKTVSTESCMVPKVTTEENREIKQTSLKKLLKDNLSKVSCEKNTQVQTDQLPSIIKQSLVKQGEPDLQKDEKSIVHTFNKSLHTPVTSPTCDDFDAVCKHLHIPKMLSPVSMDFEMKPDPLNTDANVMVEFKRMPDPLIADQKPKNQLVGSLASTSIVTQELEYYSLPKTNVRKSIFSPESVTCETPLTFEKAIEECSSPMDNPKLQLKSAVQPKIQSENYLEKVTENSDAKQVSLDKQHLLNQLHVTLLKCPLEDRNILSKKFSPNNDQVNPKEIQVNESSVIESVSKSSSPFKSELEMEPLPNQLPVTLLSSRVEDKNRSSKEFSLNKNHPKEVQVNVSSVIETVSKSSNLCELELKTETSNTSIFHELFNLDQAQSAISDIHPIYKEKDDNSKENNSQIDSLSESEFTNLLNSPMDETFLKLLNDDDQDMPLDLSFKEDCVFEKSIIQEITPNDKPIDFSSPSKLRKPARISTVVNVSPDTTTASPNTKSPKSLGKLKVVLEKLPSSPLLNVSSIKKCKKLNNKSSNISTKDINLSLDIGPNDSPRSPEGLKHYHLRTNLLPPAIPYQHRSQKSPKLNCKERPKVDDKGPQTAERSPEGLKNYNLRLIPSPTAIHYQQCSPKSPNSKSKKSPKSDGKSPVDTHFQNTQESPQISSVGSRSAMKGSNKENMSSQRSPEDMKNSSKGLKRSPENMKKSPDGIKRSPDGMKKSPDGMKRSPNGMKKSPSGMKRSPSGMKRSPDSIERLPEDMKRSPEGMYNYSLRPVSLPNYCDTKRKMPRSPQSSPKKFKLHDSCEDQCITNSKISPKIELKSCNTTPAEQSKNKLPSQTKTLFNAKELFYSSRELRGLPPLEPPVNMQPLPVTEELSVKIPEDIMSVDYTKYSLCDRASFGGGLVQPFLPNQASQLSYSKTVIGDKSPKKSPCKSINSTIQQGKKENSQCSKLGKDVNNHCQSSPSPMVMEEKKRSAKNHSLQVDLNTYLRRKALKLENKNIKLFKPLDTATSPTRKNQIKRGAISESLNCRPNQDQDKSQILNPYYCKTLYDTDIDLKTDAYLKSDVTFNQDDLFLVDDVSTSYPSYSNALLCIPFKNSNIQRTAALTVASCKNPSRKSCSEKGAGKIKTRLSREELKMQNLLWIKLIARRRSIQSDSSPLHSPIPLQTTPDNKKVLFAKSTDSNSLSKPLDDLSFNEASNFNPLHSSVSLQTTRGDDKVLISVKSSDNNILTSKASMTKQEAFPPVNMMRTHSSKLELKKEDNKQSTNTCSESGSEINKTVHLKPQQSQAKEILLSQSPDRFKVKSFGAIVLDFTKKENLTYFEDLNLILNNIGVQPKPVSNKDNNVVKDISDLNINNVSVMKQGIDLSDPIQSGYKATSAIINAQTEDQYFLNKASKLKKNQDVADYLHQSSKIIKHIESKVKMTEEKKNHFLSKRNKICLDNPDFMPNQKKSATSSSQKTNLLASSSLYIAEEEVKPGGTTEKNSTCSINTKLPMKNSFLLKSPEQDLPQTSTPNLDSLVPAGNTVDNKRIRHFGKEQSIPATITSSMKPIMLNPSEAEHITTTECSLPCTKNDNNLNPILITSSDRLEHKNEDSSDSEDELVMDVDEELLLTLNSICSPTNHDISSEAVNLDLESQVNTNLAKSSNCSLIGHKTQEKPINLLGEIERQPLTPELCYAPINLKPLPKAMYRYDEKLTITNFDFSRPQNISPSFSFYQSPCSTSMSNDIRTQLAKEDPGEVITPNLCPDNKDFTPKFYTECNPRMKLNKEIIDPQNINVEENVFKFPTHIGYKKKSLFEFLPKGAKVKVTGNVLRTAFLLHGENLAQYVARNVTEQRKTIKPCQAKQLNKAETILQPLITSDIVNLLELYRIADALKHFECRTILSGLVSVIKKEIERLRQEPGNDKFQNWLFNVDRLNETLPNHKSPTVHPRVQAMVTLITLIDGRKEESTKLKSGFVEESIDFLEKMFFGSVEKQQHLGEVDLLVCLGFVYTCLARLRGELVRVRRTMYDLLYCFTKTALSLSYCILRTWPAVLRVMPIESYCGDPLALAMIHALTRVPPSRFNNGNYTRHRIYSCHSLLRHTYKFTTRTTDGDLLFDMFLTRLCQQDVHEAMILLAKSQSTEWFKRRPKKELLEVVQRWRKTGDGETEAAAAINILCCVSRAFNYDDWTENVSLIELLSDILHAETTPFWMQELVVLNLCRLSRTSWPYCVKIIASWRPTQLSSEIIDKIIIDIIAKKSEVFWKSSTGSQYLSSR